MFKVGDKVRRKKEYIHVSTWMAAYDSNNDGIFTVSSVWPGVDTIIMLEGSQKSWIANRFELVAEEQPKKDHPQLLFHPGDIVMSGSSYYIVTDSKFKHSIYTDKTEEQVTARQYNNKTKKVGDFVGTHHYSSFKMHQPAGPVKMSTLSTTGMNLKEVLDRWERLDKAGLIIQED